MYCQLTAVTVAHTWQVHHTCTGKDHQHNVVRMYCQLIAVTVAHLAGTPHLYTAEGNDLVLCLDLWDSDFHVVLVRKLAAQPRQVLLAQVFQKLCTNSHPTAVPGSSTLTTVHLAGS